ncbi:MULTISPECIES: tRNA pseudouridine(55) synthase TruB [Pseudoalteromonas]|uniref:tRNA pseudouridine synthase B n=1 Tax=Pseudoalteromonas ruthenica TaxID=151081 RepID=A0A0F4Q3L7_9GAMM|nr:MULTISPECIES: tRNA pseudouridine(55) synthase TruB [Pseudoalteromonas]KJZ00800.1 pseudouridine synthase [Pseudoalteromonas ruthenica]KJZ01147.1 pseudouridine synthase [Pseudoalteromonas ruthenica]MCG7571298.1 tRNA pseudouridine(55) synthase TruB [Pseudoalteromonas sp. CNC9-20]TLX51085.1 tRNA pseudouridine(55) synthase TruB [Pseudoalteromonas ruthenica]TMO85688.1 tRNA pseudouridine(55) synthase TruB [Pseudoalteromonas ruthenica]
MARRTKGRPVDGVLLVNKPQGISSNRALQQAKGIFFAQKAGHTGALDPLATGMLPVCFGEATKFSQFLLDTDKTYVVRAKLGERTTTSDADGEIVQTRAVDVCEADLREQVASFIGESDQYPSMYSALKYQGQPLYKYAREGIEVPRKCRRIHVYSLTLDEFDSERNEIQMTAHVSKGTYIRTIVDDLGELLGCGAHVIMLHRSKVGHYPAEKMVTLETLQQLLDEAKAKDIAPAEVLDPLLLPMDTAVQDLPSIELDEQQATAFAHGQTVVVGEQVAPVCAVRCKTRFLGVGERNQHGHLKAKRAVAITS